MLQPQFRQVSKHFYPNISPDWLHEDYLSITAEGRLCLQMAHLSEMIDLPNHNGAHSVPIMLPEIDQQQAFAAEGRLRLFLRRVQHHSHTEFWLHHADMDNERSKRLKLMTEWQTADAFTPRLATLPDERHFVVDDGGVLRFYTSEDLTEAGAVQVAQHGTGNQLLVLAASRQQPFVAALSRSKNLILYSLTEQRTLFVRQINDTISMYSAHGTRLYLAEDAAWIVVAGSGYLSDAPQSFALSLSVFERVAS